MMVAYGNVYLRDPVDDELYWYDCCTHADYVRRYGNYDTGRFIWVKE